MPSKNEKTLQFKATAARRLDLLLKEKIEKSRSELRAMVQAGLVKVDSQTVSEPGLELVPGQEVSLSYETNRRYREKKSSFRSGHFKVLYEDNYILVIEKKAGVLTELEGKSKTQPLSAFHARRMPREREAESLIEEVNRYLSIKGGRASGAHLVHRLDRDTSGVLLIAKHANLAKAIKEQFAEHKPEREYVAIVRGILRQKSGTIKSYLATDENLNQYSLKNEKEAEKKGGKLAITHYRLLKQLPDAALIAVNLETGRRNQIRVHFAERGHPVLGDVRYKAIQAKHPLWPHKRLALHARKLSFRHPVNKKVLRFETLVPIEFEKFVKAAGRQTLTAGTKPVQEKPNRNTVGGQTKSAKVKSARSQTKSAKVKSARIKAGSARG